MKSQTAFMQNQGQILSNRSQVISRLQMQMSQLVNSLSERPKGTLPNQPLVKPKNSNQAYQIQDSSINQCNVAHSLRSGKKVDNQVYQQKNPSRIDPAPASIFSSSSQSAPQTSDKDTAAKQVHKPVAPIPNWLRNNNKNMHMEMSRPASQNTWKRSRDESRRRIYARKIHHVYTLSLK